MLHLACKSATQKQQADQTRVDEAKTALLTNRIAVLEQAGQMVYATGVALDRFTASYTNIFPAIKVAKDLNERASLTLGPPDLDDAIYLRQMVDDLLSENAKIKARGEEELRGKDHEITDLQTSRDTLKGDLAKVEAKLAADYKRAATKAEKWEKLVGWIHKIMWIIGISIATVIGVNVAAMAYPPLLPVAAIVNRLTGGIFGGLGAAVFRLIPTAKKSAGVVDESNHVALQQEHAVSETTLSHLVTAIGNLRNEKPEVFETVVKPYLKDTTSDDLSRPKIKEVQAKLASAG